MPERAPLRTAEIESDPRTFLNHLYEVAVEAGRPGRQFEQHLESISSTRVMVIGAGKAAALMAQKTEQKLSSGAEGLVIVPDGYRVDCERIDVVEASHPHTDMRGVRATRQIMSIAERAGQNDHVLCLLSGGASALLAVPASGVELAGKRQIVSGLMARGSSIDELNCVRKHLSAVKGGRLAKMVAPARILSLIISDVVGDDPATIGSGPTVPDPTTCDDALRILEKYEIDLPHGTKKVLMSEGAETPKFYPFEAPVHIVASARNSLNAVVGEVKRWGLNVHDLGDRCSGDAKLGAERHAAVVRSILEGHGPVDRPCVILSGGEYTTRVTGPGKGGPNTEFALALALQLGSPPNVWALAADTDGLDGTTDGAGAIVAPNSLAQAERAGRNANLDIENSNSAAFFEVLGDVVKPGPTFTNVNDFRAIYVGEPSN